MSTAGVALVLIVVILAAALSVATMRLRSRERALRAAVVAHVDAVGRIGSVGAAATVPTSTDAAVAMLGRLGASIEERVNAEERQRRLMIGAVERIRPHLFLADTSGVELFRNAPGATVGTAEGDAILEGAVRELLKKASGGLIVDRELNLAGPPRKDFLLRAFPVEHLTFAWLERLGLARRRLRGWLGSGRAVGRVRT